MIFFLELLQKWNTVFNLTAIRDLTQSINLHLIDSLIVHPFVHGQHIIDVGSGAGLPGIPLALLCPDKQFVLLDSLGKKTRFIQHAVYALGLKNVEVVQSRVEDYQSPSGFDSILTRAFATLAVMIDKTHHLLGSAGQFVAMKGVYPDEEIRQLPPHFNCIAHRLAIAGLSVERHVVCIERN